MGFEVNVGTYVGFLLQDKDALKPFLTACKEVSHLEPRYDIKTGKRLKDQKVIDSGAGFILRVPGNPQEHDYDEEGWEPPWEFLDDLGDYLDCEVVLEKVGESYCVGFAIRHPHLKMKKTDYRPHCNVDVSEDLDFEILSKLGPALKDLSKRLKKVGLKAGKARVFTAVMTSE